MKKFKCRINDEIQSPNDEGIVTTRSTQADRLRSNGDAKASAWVEHMLAMRSIFGFWVSSFVIDSTFEISSFVIPSQPVTQ